MNWFQGTRTVDVAVAVYFCGPDVGFLLEYNQQWGGYSFPSRRMRGTEPRPGHAARLAFRDATGVPPDHVTAKPLFHSKVTHESQRTRRPTNYRYHGFEIDTDPTGVLALSDIHTGPACRLQYLSIEQFPKADLLTWTARHVVSELLEHQNVAVAAVVREGPGGREYLMIHNASYHGYFPCASRIRSDVEPRYQVREGLRADTGYNGGTVAGDPQLARDEHHSPRFGCTRKFNYHVSRITFPPHIDLHVTGNVLEQALARSGALWRWVPDEELDDPGVNGLSPTTPVIRNPLRAI